jgi:hypothetical protein
MMRRLAMAVALLAFTVPAVAQQKRGVSIFVSNPSVIAGSSSGTQWEGGVGAAAEFPIASRVAAFVSVADERYYAMRSIDTPTFRLVRYGYRVRPIDVMARYTFVLHQSRWSPYLGAGLRYVHGPSFSSAPNGSTTPIGDLYRITPELNGGVLYEVNHTLGLFADVKQGLGSSSPHYDPLAKGSFGIRFGF